MAFQGDSIYWVEVEKVVPNPFQPRREFDQNKLQELAESIRMYGVLQPLTVTRKEVQREDGTFYSEYELIAGERRLRASKLAGVAQVPVIIREGEQSEQEKLELAIIENLQREDLNAVDRAIAFKQLAEQFGLSHALVAKKVGRSREYVSNSIRLLGLPDHMLEALKRGEMMEGHARTLLMLTDRPEEQDVVFREILLKKLSVREVERIVRKIATDKVRKKIPGEFDIGLIELEKKFTETLGTRVQILKTDFGGKLTIDYFSEEDLESILKRIKDEVVEQAYPDVKMAEKISENTPLEVTVEPEIDNYLPELPEELPEATSVPVHVPVPNAVQTQAPIMPIATPIIPATPEVVVASVPTPIPAPAPIPAPVTTPAPTPIPAPVATYSAPIQPVEEPLHNYPPINPIQTPEPVYHPTAPVSPVPTHTSVPPVTTLAEESIFPPARMGTVTQSAFVSPVMPVSAPVAMSHPATVPTHTSSPTAAPFTAETVIKKEEEVTPKPTFDEDDSSLYSMRNFGV